MLEEQEFALIKQERIQEFNPTFDQIHNFQEPIKCELSTEERKKSEPTQQDLCETVVILKKIMPTRSLKRAIQMINEILNPDKKGFERPVAPSYSEVASQPPEEDSSQVIKSFQKEALLKAKFATPEQQLAYKQKRLLAKAFVAKGYGYQHALQQLKKAKLDININSFTKQFYKKSMSLIGIQAFRRLENFLSEDCKKKITPITKQEMKKLITPLLSVTPFQDSISVYKKYFRLLYGLSNVTIAENESLKFYQKAMKTIYGPSFTLKNSNQSSVVQKKNAQLEKENSVQGKELADFDDGKLIQVFESCLSIQQTAQILKQEGCTQAQVQKIDSRLSLLTKLAIKKVQTDVQTKQLEFPELISINSALIDFICKSHRAVSLKVQLLRYFLGKNADESQLMPLLHNLKQFFASNERQMNEGEGDMQKNQANMQGEINECEIYQQTESEVKQEDQPQTHKNQIQLNQFH